MRGKRLKTLLRFSKGEKRDPSSLFLFSLSSLSRQRELKGRVVALHFSSYDDGRPLRSKFVDKKQREGGVLGCHTLNFTNAEHFKIFSLAREEDVTRGE